MKKGFKKALLKYYWLSNCSFNLKKKNKNIDYTDSKIKGNAYHQFAYIL